MNTNDSLRQDEQCSTLDDRICNLCKKIASNHIWIIKNLAGKIRACEGCFALRCQDFLDPAIACQIPKMLESSNIGAKDRWILLFDGGSLLRQPISSERQCKAP